MIRSKQKRQHSSSWETRTAFAAYRSTLRHSCTFTCKSFLRASPTRQHLGDGEDIEFSTQWWLVAVACMKIVSKILYPGKKQKFYVNLTCMLHTQISTTGVRQNKHTLYEVLVREVFYCLGKLSK